MTPEEIRRELLTIHIYQGFDNEADTMRELSNEHPELSFKIQAEFEVLSKAEAFSDLQALIESAIGKVLHITNRREFKERATEEWLQKIGTAPPAIAKDILKWVQGKLEWEVFIIKPSGVIWRVEKREVNGNIPDPIFRDTDKNITSYGKLKGDRAYYIEPQEVAGLITRLVGKGKSWVILDK